MRFDQENNNFVERFVSTGIYYYKKKYCSLILAKFILIFSGISVAMLIFTCEE